MNQPAAAYTYTPLESLFLFQSLLAHGVDAGAFARTSELLRGNALIKGGETYDAARLSADALQQLFLRLLRDELKSEADRAAEVADGTGSPGSRKRKIGSPPLPSLKDAFENIDKVPALVDRLYARYRENVVKQVREDERRFLTVQKEIQLLERSERERLAKAASQTGTPTLAPRDVKSQVGSNGPSPAPTAAQRAVAAIKRGPTPNTPVFPPRPPNSSIAPPTATPPIHTPAGTPPVQTSASPKPPSGPASGLQAPAGLAQQTPRVLQPPGQVPKPSTSISPRPDAGVKGSEAVGTPPGSAAAAAAAVAAGNLKWEKPYQPPQSSQTPPGGPFQPPPPNSAGPQKVQLQQTPQQQQQQQQPWQPPKGQYPQQGPGTPGQAQPLQSRPPHGKVVPVPQNAGQVAQPLQPGPPRPAGAAPSPQPRPASTTPVPTPGRPNQSQLPQQGQQTPRPIASAAPTHPKATPGQVVQPQGWTPAQLQGQRSSPSASPAPLASQKDKPYNSPYVSQPPRPAIPGHIVRQAAATPGPTRRINTSPSQPQTPQPGSPVSLTRGFGTKWATHSTPSTPGPIAVEPESPAFEPVSPPQRAAVVARDTPKSVPKKQVPKSTQKSELSVPRPGRGRPPRNAQKGRGVSTTPSATGTGRSQSVTSQTDELSMDYSTVAMRIKNEESTPRPHDDTGDTTADESVHGRTHMVTPGSVSSRLAKRKRQDTPIEPPAVQTHVLWTRGFTKVSSSALDQISSHRDANMFATALREKDAPGYRQIVLQPQDITSIRSAIKQGNKAAVQAAVSLPGGDPGTASVWLPVSDDLVPPRGIINSAHLERELVHMFCNAIMYNPDPNRGPGRAFMKRTQEEEDEIVGYRLDENGVVKNTQSMFLEVEKLLGDLRSAEKQRGAPPLPGTRPASVATPADDTAEDEDELAGDGDVTSGPVKRRRISTRG